MVSSPQFFTLIPILMTLMSDHSDELNFSNFLGTIGWDYIQKNYKKSATQRKLSKRWKKAHHVTHWAQPSVNTWEMWHLSTVHLSSGLHVYSSPASFLINSFAALLSVESETSLTLHSMFLFKCSVFLCLPHPIKFWKQSWFIRM